MPETERWSKVFVVLQAYFDDSGSEPQSPLFVMAGLVASAQKWAEFSTKWKSELDLSPTIKYFRMAQANSLKGEFYGWSANNRNEKVARLCTILSNHVQFSILMFLSWSDYNEILEQLSDNPFKPYDVLFYGSIKGTVSILEQFNIKEQIDFIFDQQGKLEKKAFEHLETGRISLPRKYLEYVRNYPIIGNDKDFMPLQAADLFAWQTRRFVHKNPKKPYMSVWGINRKALEALLAVPIYRRPIQREFLVYLKTKWIESRSSFGARDP